MNINKYVEKVYLKLNLAQFTEQESPNLKIFSPLALPLQSFFFFFFAVIKRNSASNLRLPKERAIQ